MLACLPLAAGAQSTPDENSVVVDEILLNDSEISVVIAEEGSNPFHWTSDALEFSLDDLSVGEQRTSVGPDGRQTIVSRHSNGYTINVDGRELELPVGDEHAHMLALVEEGHLDDLDVHIVGDDAAPVMKRIMKSAGHDGVVIISEDPLDPSVQESIRSVLISAGINEDVQFVNSSSKSAKHERRIEIRREVVREETR